MNVQAEVSLYPLRVGDLAGVIHGFIHHLKEAGLEVESGPISTWVAGESADIFRVICEAWEKTAEACEATLVVKVSNAAPWRRRT